MKYKVIIIFLVLLFSLMGYAVISYYHQIDLGPKTVTIIIKPGDNFHTTVDKLINNRVVNSKTMLLIAGRFLGIDKKLTPGRYEFKGKNSCYSVLRKLAAADFVKIKITIPEGSTIWKVASIIAHKLELDSAAFVALNHNSSFLQKYKISSLEGYLFPETYFFPWGTSDTNIINDMIKMYHNKTDSLWPDTIIDNLSRYDILKLASIIEAETGLDNERPLVSSVYHNRLKKYMRLDADPTVIYGLGGLKRPLFRKDLKRNTPFNTYLHYGLPPTPINSPGLASIRAALYPETTSYLYFVANENGRHFFSRTNAEHNRMKRKIRTEKRKLLSPTNHR